jgi:transposase
VRHDRVVELLKTIPGAGIITVAAIRAYVDDIGRFLNYKQLSAYAGEASDCYSLHDFLGKFSV